MQLGTEIPVSPRDNHRIHLEVVKAELGKILPGIAENAAQIPSVGLMLQHGANHIEAAIVGGAKDSEFSEDKKLLQAAAEQLGQLVATLEAQQSLTQPVEPAAGMAPVPPAPPEALPAPVPAAPVA